MQQVIAKIQGPSFAAVIARDLGIKESQASNTIQLLESGNTVPFIARYRKEATGELDENYIRDIEEKLEYLKNLSARREEILRLIGEQGKLTPELERAVHRATKMGELEDIYRPYRQKRRTRATMAKEKGLEPLAAVIWAQEQISGSVESVASRFVDPAKGVDAWEDAVAGALDIIAEDLSDDIGARNIVRNMVWEEGIISCKGDAERVKGTEYENYKEYSEPVKRIPPHRVLAINRGESEEILKVKIDLDSEKALARLRKYTIRNSKSIFQGLLEDVVADSYKRLIFPSVEREIRSAMTDTSGAHAIKLFGTNLKSLLLQPPIRGYRVMGIDPGFRTGSKAAVIDETGKVLDTATIYPHPPQDRYEEAKEILAGFVIKYNVGLISIGNGTASRETESLVADLIKNLGQTGARVHYIIVNEAGASVYSASKLAGAELPDMDVSMRGAVSIARRCQDPLAELVKIEPKSVGVGLYQHDVDQKKLQESLEDVVESCVNFVGVDLNTASPSLLQHVAGVQPSVAKNIVAFREKNGPFAAREELKKIPRLGEQTFIQCAGFLRIPEGRTILDDTSVHPESYEAATEILSILGFTPEDLRDKEKFAVISRELCDLDPRELSQELGIGIPTIKDIIDALRKPGRDPREELPKPILRTDVLSMDDLEEGMVLKGTVRNVVDFGAFVDIGVKQDGLVHISEISDSFIKHPTQVLSVGDIVDVRVIGVDRIRKRISLSMKLNDARMAMH